MSKLLLSSALAVFILAFQPSSFAQWIDFTDATAQWLSIGADGEEKDVAVADLDKDGHTDVVVVRKSPFSNPGARTDLLLMNTGNELIDQTATYAPGFISNPSDSRDVFIGDFDNDTWQDVVIANTFEDQPIFYHNLGEDGNGNWLGLADESTSRFPLPVNVDPLQFCALWGGDVTGDGYLDLYFSNYDPNGISHDLLLINDGNGNFTDETLARLGNLRNSAFGTSVEIHDMDNDGDQDIVKISTLFHVFPWNDNGVFLLFNDGTGNFSNWQKIPSNKPYMFTVGDLNNDNKLDVYVVDDDQDYVDYAGAIIPDQSISYTLQIIPDPRAAFFGGNCKFGDLDNDNDLDLGLADVDVDIPPCETGNSIRKFTMMRNSGGSLNAPYGSTTYPWNQSTFDFGFVDLNGDGKLDIFQARCTSYKVFLNEPPVSNCTVAITGEQTTCPGNPAFLQASSGFSTYQWNNGATGQSISVTAAGEYCVTATDAQGCTASECIEVSALPPIETNLEVDICEGETYAVGNSVYSEGGVYLDVLDASNGCDSVVTLTLNVLPVYFNVVEASICEGTCYEVGEFCYEVAGEYLIPLTAANGCDSIVLLQLEVLNNSSSSIDAEICPGETYSVGDSTYTTSGDYQVVLTAANGCDSTVSLNLSLLPESSAEVSAEICAGESYEIGDMSFTEAGQYEVTLVAANGCDSIVSLNLGVLPESSAEVSAEICAGESYEIGGMSYTEAGQYEVALVAANGCDSTVSLNLIVLPESSTELSPEICAGESYEIGGVSFTEAGQYEVTLVAANGCDSTVSLNLIVLPESSAELSAEICAGESYEIGDMSFTEAGQYAITLAGANGCDSTVSLNLSVLPESSSELSAAVCAGESYEIGDSVYTEAGQYQVVLTAVNGCDSIVSLDLSILQDTTNLSIDICEGEGFQVGGMTFFETGEYQINLVNTEGCDSLVLLDLTVHPSIMTSMAVESCGPFEMDGMVYTESGSYQIMDIDQYGCDSIFTLLLTIHPEMVLGSLEIINDNGSGNGSISVGITGGTPPFMYEWSNGATTAEIGGLEAGEYPLTVTDAAGCTYESTFVVELQVSAGEATRKGIDIAVFPNPFASNTRVNVEGAGEEAKRLQVYDVTGRLLFVRLFTGKQLTFEDPLPAGLYLFRVEQEGEVLGSVKVVKM